jgi:hypothetical protein
MFMDPRYKAIVLLEDEVKLAINVIENEINDILQIHSHKRKKYKKARNHPACCRVLWTDFLK